MTNPIDNLIKCLLKINELYSPPDAKIYNFTYISKLAMIPNTDPAKKDTIHAICSSGISSILDTLEIPRLPRLQYKVLQQLIRDVLDS